MVKSLQQNRIAAARCMSKMGPLGLTIFTKKQTPILWWKISAILTVNKVHTRKTASPARHLGGDSFTLQSPRDQRS